MFLPTTLDIVEVNMHLFAYKTKLCKDVLLLFPFVIIVGITDVDLPPGLQTSLKKLAKRGETHSFLSTPFLVSKGRVLC